MESNKILSADLLDIIFDDRNKDYGAYALRKTYSQRIGRAMLITGIIAGMAFGGAILASSIDAGPSSSFEGKEFVISQIPPPDEIIPPKEPEVKVQQQQVKTEIFVTPKIEEDENVTEPPPSQNDLDKAKVANFKQEGPDDDDVIIDEPVPDEKGIIDIPQNKEPEVWRDVQVQAKFTGDWQRFLLRNLNPNVPVDHDAPFGKYAVDIEFIVDKDGTISNIKAVSSNGYGMEDEGIRVIKKSQKWEPAIQNGYPVKAYRIQRIIFEVLPE